jgi:beta-1,4-mannosyltransferase
MRVLIFPRHIRSSNNPYGELLYRDMPAFGIATDRFSLWRTLRGRYDIFHLHWPEYYLNHSWPKAVMGSLLVLFSTAWLRRRGTRILWTVHNPHSHALSHPSIEAWFWRTFTSMLDGFVSLSDSCTKWVSTGAPRLSQAESAVIPHGHYREAYPAPVAPASARQALGLTPDQTVVLFFGGVSRYKNVPHLIATFREADLPDTILLIAGRADAGQSRQVALATQGDKRIKLDLRRIPRDEVQLLFSSADLVVLPFSCIMHSGSAILALSFNKPVLVPALGSLPELQACVGPEWVRTYEGELTPAILSQAAAWAKGSDRRPCPDLSPLDWPQIVQATVHLYSRLCAQPSRLRRPGRPITNAERRIGHGEPPVTTLACKTPQSPDPVSCGSHTSL